MAIPHLFASAQAGGSPWPLYWPLYLDDNFSYVGGVSVNAISDLRALVSPPPVVVMGYRTTPGDGGGGIFSWYPNDATPADNALVVAPTSSAVGRYKRVYSGPVDVRWFGAKGDGVTDDTSPIQSAIDSLPTAGGQIYLPPSTSYYLVTGLRIDGTDGTRANVEFFGGGVASKLFLKDSTASNVIAAEGGSGFYIHDISIDGNKAHQTVGGNYRVFNGLRLRNVIGAFIRNVVISNCAYIGIQPGAADLTDGTGSSRIIVSDSRFENNSTGMAAMRQSGNSFSNCDFISNVTYGCVVDQFSDSVGLSNCQAIGNGNNGIYVYDSSKVEITNSICKSNSGAGIVLDNGSNYCAITGGYSGQNGAHGVLIVGGGFSNTVTGIAVETNTQNGIYVSASGDNTVVGCTARGNYFSGINIQSSPNCVVSDNRTTFNRGSGILIDGATNGSMSGNLSTDNCSTNANAIDSGIRLINTSTSWNILGNTCFDDQSVKTQNYGIRLEGSTASNTVRDNILTANKTAALIDLGTGNSFRDNTGYITENSGTASIAAAATAVVVSHGLSVTPVPQDISVSPASDWGASSRWWVSAVTSTTFTINTNAAPGVSFAFQWSATATG